VLRLDDSGGPTREVRNDTGPSKSDSAVAVSSTGTASFSAGVHASTPEVSSASFSLPSTIPAHSSKVGTAGYAAWVDKGTSKAAMHANTTREAGMRLACMHSMASLAFLLHELDLTVHGGNGLFSQQISAGIQSLREVVEGCSFINDPEAVAQDVVDEKDDYEGGGNSKPGQDESGVASSSTSSPYPGVLGMGVSSMESINPADDTGGKGKKKIAESQLEKFEGAPLHQIMDVDNGINALPALPQNLDEMMTLRTIPSAVVPGQPRSQDSDTINDFADPDQRLNVKQLLTCRSIDVNGSTGKNFDKSPLEMSKGLNGFQLGLGLGVVGQPASSGNRTSDNDQTQ